MQATQVKISEDAAKILTKFGRSRKIRHMLERSHRKNTLVNLSGKDIDRVYFDALHLKKLDCSNTKGILVFARQAQMPRSNWERANLWSAYMLKSDLRWANFRHAFLPYYHAWLAKLWKADFTEAFLEGADFTEADLRGADFTGADLTRARFTRAKVEGTIFKDAKGLDTAIDLDLKNVL